MLTNPFVLISAAVCLGVVGQIMMKSGMNQVGAISSLGLATLLRVFSNPYVLLGFASYGLSSIAYLMALSKLELSVAYPMIGLGYVLVVLFSWLLLKEQVGALRWLGTLLIVAGVWLVGR
ncbi:MAG TPA: SMR family transporter [Anaerolineae bacterium]|nr:SMR family transporter [Anaerolineae bacterium]HOR00423.1 SMR family transporter [Anaerolineae bacterium]HPL27339.1 SMR family transporter [Anaerolineae bacterium]